MCTMAAVHVSSCIISYRYLSYNISVIFPFYILTELTFGFNETKLLSLLFMMAVNFFFSLATSCRLALTLMTVRTGI